MVVIIVLFSFGWYFPFRSCIHFSSIDIQQVLFKPEGKSIVQHTAFIYNALCQGRDATGIMHAMKMSMVNLSDVKQHVPISHSRKKGMQLDLCKALWPLTSFLEVHTADHCSLPISRWKQQTNLYHYFAYYVKKKPNFHSAMKMKFKSVSHMTCLPCSSVNLTESEKSLRRTVSRLHIFFGNNI